MRNSGSGVSYWGRSSDVGDGKAYICSIRIHANAVLLYKRKHRESSSTTVICRPCARQRERDREKGREGERKSLQSLMINASFSCSRVTPPSKAAGPKVANLEPPYQTRFSHSHKEERLKYSFPQMLSKVEIKTSRSPGMSRKRADGSLPALIKGY